jgi:4-hydroxy-tetrahydrodipicolinate synthase
MNEIKKFVPVMITPFDNKGRIDMNAVFALVDFYLNAGVKGLFANCLSSEMFSLTEDERLELTRRIVQYVDGRVPVVATGSFGQTISDKARFTRQIYDTGVDAVIMITAHFAQIEESDTTLLANFFEMLQQTGSIPLGLYECPAPYKRILGPDVFQQLIDTGRFIYHKDTSIKTEWVQEKLAICNRQNVLEFYDAHTPNALSSLRGGARGMSSISGNFYPELMVWLCEHANDPACSVEAEWLQKELTAVDPIIHEAYPLSAKYFLQKRGLPLQPTSRTQVVQLTTSQQQQLDELFKKFYHWCERLDIKPATVTEVLVK